MIENLSGIHPKGRAVLIQMVELEDLKATMIKIPDSVQRTSSIMDQKGRVIEIGGECWADEREPRAKIGDKVLVTRMAGWVTQGKDGKVYRLVNDRDIFGQLEE